MPLLQREDVVQANLLASPERGEPAITLVNASLSWEARDMQKTILHDISLQVCRNSAPLVPAGTTNPAWAQHSLCDSEHMTYASHVGHTAPGYMGFAERD